MERHLFVGREEQLAELNNLLTQAARGQGSIAFIEGEAGMGKTEFLEVAQDRVHRSPELKRARFAFGYSYEDTGAQNAYQPLVEILSALTKADRKGGDIAQLILSLIKETGADWLQMIPGIGPAITAGVKTAVLTGQWFLETPSDQLSNAAGLASQYANTIAKIASRYSPLVLVVEDAHWIDEASCRLILRIARRIREQSLIILLTYRPSYVSEAHPLRRMQSEVYAQNLAHKISLTGLTETQMQSYVQARFGNPISPHLAAWLTHLCNGNPLFVSQYLNLLVQNRIVLRQGDTYILDGRIDYSTGEWHVSVNIPIPDSVEAILEQHIQRLIEDDQKMLLNAAVQGEKFMSSVLSELLQINELELLPRLRAIVENYHLIRYGTETEQWVDQNDEVYAFEHVLMHRVFCKKLSPRERVLYHHRVAEILERIIKDDNNPPRRVVIEVARHYDLGHSPLLAARYYYLAAQSCFASGAFKETSQLCQSALEKIRSLREGVPDHHKLHAEIIQLLLFASEMWWHGRPHPQDELPLSNLAEEAIGAALRTSDKALLAKVQFLKGRILIATKGLSDAIATMKEALETARTANDKLGEFSILSHLGYITKAEDFSEGIALSYQAYNLYKDHLEARLTQYSAIGLERHYYRLQGFIGIGEFDRGNYDEALKWLKESILGLKRLKMQDDLLRMLNFLGQVYIATGLFESAETTLKESVDLVKDDEAANPWAGYNLALLGKLYIEWQRVEDAIEPILKGWQLTQSTWNVDLVRLVRMYYIELLMHPDYRARDLIEAKHQLKVEIEETQSSGFHDMAIAALSMQGQLELTLRNLEAAVNYSTQAIQYLEKMGMKLPALRTEEILFNHHLVLRHVTGRSSDAVIYLDRAHTILQQKASTLRDKSHRRSFLERVPISQAIMSAWDKHQTR